MSSPWKKLCVNTPKVRIRLNLTLQGGQSFRWRETAPGEWTNVLCGYVWTLKQSENDIFYRVYESVVENSKRILKEISTGNKTSCHLTDKKSDIYESILRDYFQLDVDTYSLFEQWRSRDPYFGKVSEIMPGVRVLRQDPVETLFAFICSSNNNIPRISGMVEKLCQEYGDKLGDIGGSAYYAFPKMKDLQGSVVEEHLRSVGFGYRAKFISQCASYILQHHDSKWLEGLRSVSYDDAHAALCQLPGVGAKVADCVCLMSLDKHEAVPVDTHLWQITTKHYMPHLVKTKSLTAKVYKQIAIKDVFNYNRQYGSAARVSNRYSCPADVTEKNIYEAVIYYSNTVVQTQNCAHKADKEAVNNSSSCKKISAGLEDRLKRTSKKFAGVVRTGVTIAPLTCSTTFGDHYRDLFGEYAGWAQSVLFAADLKRFQDIPSVTPVNMKSSSGKRSVESMPLPKSSYKPSTKKKKKTSQ